MKQITKEDIKVLGRIVSISTENVVADASQVWDSEQKKDQETINDSLINKTDNATTSKYGIVRLAVNASDPDNNDVVTVKTMRDAISEAVDALLAGEMTLDTFRELAEALNNDPNFYTWVTNQLALKADKSALDALTNRVSALESDVAYLKACCAEVQEYMQHFSITWNQAKGGNHVRISPTTIKFGSDTVLFTIDDGYYLGEPISTSNVEGSYATVSCTESNGTYTLILTGVEGNVVINAPIKKEFTVTFMGDGHATSSNTSTKTVKGAYTTNIIAATNYYLDTSTVRPRYATSAQEYTDQMFSFSFGTSGADYSSDSSSTVAVRASISLSGVNGDIIIPAGTKPLKRTVKVNLTGDGGATFSGATGQMNRGTSYSGTITVPSNSTLDSVVVQQYVMSSPGSGYWTNVTSTYYNSSTRTISTTNLHDDITINIRSSAQGTGPTPPDPITNGSVTLVVNNGTANPSTGYLDGEFSSVITPNTGYTLTGAEITSTDSFIEPKLENGVLTISQIGLEDITVTVTLPAEGTSHITNVSPASFEWVAGSPNDSGDKRVIADVSVPQQWSSNMNINQYVDVTLSDSTNFTYQLSYTLDDNDNTKTKVKVGIWSTTNRDADHTTLSASATINYKENGATVETITVPLYKYGYPYVSWKATAPSQTGRTLTKDSDNEYTLTLSSGNKTSMSGNLAVVNLSAGLRYKGTSGAPSDSTANPRIYDYKNGAPSAAGTPACDIYSGQNIYQRSDSYDDTAQNYFATYISKNEYLTVEVYDANGNLLSNRVITDTNPASGGSHGIGGTTSGSDYTTALNGTDFKVALDYAYSLTLGQDPVKLYFLTDNASQNKYVVKVNHYDHGTNANTGEFILNVTFEAD